ncbi:MAG TPA: 4'-phosphopantetheinyl transferase superfamily protein [Rhizomicrobium sp.]|nr:4'-phosphopantetheinyl transferase superfamily protein [Rhizomicrobium sp.]
MSIVRSELWQALLPPGVIVYETRDFTPGAPLFDIERAAVANAVPKRVAEFAAGRLCARAALAELGHPNVPLPRAPDRRPLWPEGIAGSITHTDTYCAAAVARDLAGIGIDAETLGRVEDALLRRICTEDEQRRLAALSATERASAATLIFSAKEAFYKCHVSAGGGWLDFHDVALDYTADSFRVSPQRPFTKSWTGDAPPIGRYGVNGDTLLCAVAFPAR